ncbi:MAG: type IV toxin-antitoxin system AbiEi family antitoxin domain-containing protein [Solirubrobacteraceae bacterium]
MSRVAALQLGAVAARQLRLLGIGRGAIAHRHRRGQLHRIFRGVYLVGHPVPPSGAIAVAAVLACGRTALISHASAAALWGFAPEPQDAVHVLMLGGHLRGRAGLRVHRTTTLLTVDIAHVRGLPATAVIRTLFDLAASDYQGLERAVSDAHAGRLVTARALQQAIEHRPGQPGAPALCRLVSLTRALFCNG